MYISCPNPSCGRVNVLVKTDGTIEVHSPEFKKTYSPNDLCRLSGQPYMDFANKSSDTGFASHRNLSARQEKPSIKSPQFPF